MVAQDNKANQIISEWSHENAKSGNTMSLYQQVADHFFQRENSVTSTRTEGEDKSLPILDPTGSLDLQDMAAGMSAIVLPPGQYFCRLTAGDDRLQNMPHIASYFNYATQILHRELFKPSCNFVLEFNEFLESWIGFGTGNIYSGWDKNNLKLKFKDWDVANYRFGVDSNGYPNRCLIKWTYTAQQAYELWGDSAGTNVVKKAISDKQSDKDEKFDFIFKVGPRTKRNPQYSDNLNYAYEECVVNATEKIVVFEGGYKQFPYHIARWLLSSQETWGRGQGTIALSADKELQKQRKAFLLCADLANNPPRETLASFEGTPKVYPGANNVVMEPNTIRALDKTLQGNFPITKDTILAQQEIIHRCFYVKVFAPLDNLPGDRRTTVEIIERVKAGYMRLILPVTRLYNECLTPLVERCVLILIENGVIQPPPPELKEFKVEYLGKLALALQEQQADAFQRFAQFAITMENVVPGFTRETINTQRAGRRMATTFGVNEGDLNTEEERANIIQERQQQEQAQMAMMAAQSAGKAYKDTSQKAEEDSPASELISNMQQ